MIKSLEEMEQTISQEDKATTILTEAMEMTKLKAVKVMTSLRVVPRWVGHQFSKNYFEVDLEMT